MTLIELMVVVAIIGILAAVAFPMYQSYVVRTKMSEVVLAASACRTRVSEIYQGVGTTAPGAGNWGCETSSPGTRFVKNVTTDANGKILAIATGFSDSALDDKVLTVTPLIGSNPADVTTDLGKPISAWRCGSSADGTTLPIRYLPSTCQGL
jgi:type IV pilus assembly protein PilA